MRNGITGNNSTKELQCIAIDVVDVGNDNGVNRATLRGFSYDVANARETNNIGGHRCVNLTLNAVEPASRNTVEFNARANRVVDIHSMLSSYVGNGVPENGNVSS